MQTKISPTPFLASSKEFPVCLLIDLPYRCPRDKDVSITSSFGHSNILRWGGALMWTGQTIAGEWAWYLFHGAWNSPHWCRLNVMSRVGCPKIQWFINYCVGNEAGTWTQSAWRHRSWTLSTSLLAWLSSGWGTEHAWTTTVLILASVVTATQKHVICVGTHSTGTRWTQFWAVRKISDNATGVATGDTLGVFSSSSSWLMLTSEQNILLMACRNVCVTAVQIMGALILSKADTESTCRVCLVNGYMLILRMLWGLWTLQPGLYSSCFDLGVTLSSWEVERLTGAWYPGFCMAVKEENSNIAIDLRLSTRWVKGHQRTMKHRKCTITIRKLSLAHVRLSTLKWQLILEPKTAPGKVLPLNPQWAVGWQSLTKLNPLPILWHPTATVTLINSTTRERTEAEG